MLASGVAVMLAACAARQTSEAAPPDDCASIREKIAKTSVDLEKARASNSPTAPYQVDTLRDLQKLYAMQAELTKC